MGIGVEIPIHEAIVFDFETANTDGFLKQYPASIFLVGQQFIKSLPVPLGLACRGRNALLLQPSGNLAQAAAAEVAVENPTDNGCFIRVNDQLAVRAGVVAVAPTLGHLGGAIPEAFLQTVPNGLTFFDVHVNLSPS